MDVASQLSRFFSAIDADARVTVTHISIYAAILQSLASRNVTCLCMFSYELMNVCKISCGKTYYKAIRELSEYGYICYEPSYHRNRASKIYLPDGPEIRFTKLDAEKSKF